MGLKKGNSAIYLSIVNGKLARRFKEPNANTVKRTTSEDSIVFEEYFRSIDGLIVGLDKKSHEKYGETLLVYIKSDHMYCLQMHMEGRYAMNFLKTLPNVDLRSEVEITPSEKIIGEGKSDQTIFIRQNNTPIKRKYTKDTADFPQPEKKKKRGGKEEWDWEPVISYLEENVYEPVRLALKDIAPAPIVDEEGPKQGSDDLPF